MDGKDKINSFMDLNAWKEGHKLVLSIYKITDDFPKIEQYGLTSQIRRAGISITSNIAEGFSRNTAGEKINFYSMALGSLSELQNQLIIARDIGYISSESYNKLASATIIVSKITNGLMRACRSTIIKA